MNIFDQYGIKEVADVTLYSIHKKQDGSGELYYMPALYLDTLKISSTEKTASNVWAEGGLGNSRLICWDYGKQINVSLEDALCTPASLGLCWGGILGSDWKDNEVNHEYGISYENRNPVERLERMEKAFYPRNDREKSTISNLLPRIGDGVEGDPIDTELGLLIKSSVVDGVKANGTGYTNGRTYRWNLAVESAVKSIAAVPNCFFDLTGKRYKINGNVPINIVEAESDDDNNELYKFSVVYSINGAENFQHGTPKGQIIINKAMETTPTTTPAAAANNPATAKYLKIRIDNNDNYTALLSNDALTWSESSVPINVEMFKGLDMWIRFNSINDMIYFLITKYSDNICEIAPATIKTENGETKPFENTDMESKKAFGKLWAYVNPKTMSPYPDDYWFHQGEPYFIKSLTLAAAGKKLKSQRIEVKAGQFPGMYMLVGETYIRERETGKDERMQIKIPLCKVKSDQNLTLEAQGSPTVFNMNLEVAKPASGIMMELTAYEVAEKMEVDANGIVRSKDGSTEVLSE